MKKKEVIDMKQEWMQNNRLGEHIYIVGGGKTYPIKETLKANGFRYSKLWGWYSCEILPIPAPYKLYHYTFDELYQWDEKYKRAFPYYEVYEEIKNIIYINKEREVNPAFMFED